MNTSKKYHVFYNNQQYGPMLWEELIKSFPPQALVWTEGMANWQPMSSLLPATSPSFYEMPINSEKKRHGCVTAWLIMMIIVNSLLSIVYLFANQIIADNLPGNVSVSLLIIMGLIGVANIVFSVLLLQWKKIGFYGFLVTSVIAVVINQSIGLGALESLFGLIGIAILYGVLQIKTENNLSAWKLLE